MNKDWSYLTERILNLTQEIIYLLTHKDNTVVKKTTGERLSPSCRSCVSGGCSRSSAQSPIMELSPPSLIPEQKILEITNKIIELLTGEVPIRCQDVTVHFSMEEWDYIEGHKDLYKDVIMEDHQLLTSPDGSSMRSPSPLYPQDCSDHNLPQDHQVYNLMNMKVEVLDREQQETHSKYNRTFKEEEIPIEISPANRQTENTLKSHHFLPPNNGTNNKDLRQTSITLKTSRRYPRLCNVPSKRVDFCPDKLQINTSSLAERQGKIFLCSDCGKQFTKYWNLLRHKRTHKVKKTFPCSECGKSFRRYSQLTGHQRRHTGEKPYACPDCGKCFMQKLYLTEHQRVHTRKKHFPCTECGKIFIRKSHLEEHQRIHTGEKPYSCSECGRSFTRKQHLVDHHRIHTGEKPFLCSECGKYFNHKSSLVHHRKTHAGRRKNTLERSLTVGPDCRMEDDVTQESLGGSPTASNVHLISHKDPSSHVERCPETTETNSKIFLCFECGKSYTDNRNLLRHQRMYRGEKSFSCSECGKCFMRKTCLNEHQRIHTGKKQFPCAECGISFTRKCHLVQHQRIHTGEKPYSCPECGRSFTRKQHLVDHQRTHTGEKPFACRECGRCFNHKISLVLHCKHHVGEKSFPCP